MDFPSDLKYTEEHEWVRIEGNIATVGITDFAQQELGDIVFVEVDTVEDELDKEDVFGTVEAVKTTSDLFMPVGGKVVAFNPELDESEGDNPAAINEDCYGKGWIVKIEIADAAEVATLLDAAAYQAVVE